MLRSIFGAFSAVRRYMSFRRDPIAAARALGVRVGTNCRFLGVTPRTFGSEPYLISIGDHVTITGGVRFVTHDGGVWVLRDEHPDLDVIAPIKIGSNVFIGLNALLLPGVTLGDNTVVAAGSVVTRSFPGDGVLGGVPAKPIRALSDYKRAVLAAGVSTKGLSPDEKREYLLSRHGTEESSAAT